MSQDERWIIRYQEVMTFVEANHRRPSKYAPEERNQWNWLRHTLKQYNSGTFKPERIEDFKKLLALCDHYKHVNQYV